MSEATSEAYEIILECIDAAFTKLGASVKDAIYYHLKKSFGLEKSQIPYNLQLFEEALTSIFGKQGTKVIKKMILIEIKHRFRLKKRLDLDLDLAELAPFIQSLSVKTL